MQRQNLDMYLWEPGALFLLSVVLSDNSAVVLALLYLTGALQGYMTFECWSHLSLRGPCQEQGGVSGF